MTYTVVGATYANEDHTSAIVDTLEAGKVAVSERDRPELWEQLKRLPHVGDFVPSPPAPPEPEAPDLASMLIFLKQKVDSLEATQAATLSAIASADKG